ncbi:MAG: VWA domain-containing protein, partial [Acidobacteria bacterium]|nr:VWA domain-containing protein [Acidobacteriota bacterium]
MKKTTLSRKCVVFSLFVVGMFLIWTTAAAVQIKKPLDKSISVAYVPNPNPLVPNYYDTNFSINFELTADLSEEVYEADSVTVECLATSFNLPKYTFNFTDAAKIYLQNGVLIKDVRKFLFSVPLTVIINNTNNDIELTKTANGIVLTAKWAQLPINLEFTARATGRFKTLHIDAEFPNEKETMVFSVNSRGQGAAPPAVGGIPGVVELDGSGRLFLAGCNETIAANIAPGDFRATMTGVGPVIVYQSGNTIYYAMYTMVQVFDPPNPTIWKCTRVAHGTVGQGQLVDVGFHPMKYGARAMVSAQNQGNRVYYVFKIDQWGNFGSTQQVGQPLATGLQHWLVQWKSVIYLFEFDPANGQLTCSSNYKNWRVNVDSGITGLIVPTATGGGPVVVYTKNQTVLAHMLKWDTGAKIETLGLGSGTLLGVNYTNRGSYGTRGTATIRANPQKQVDFCLDMWGDLTGDQAGCNRVLQTTTLPPGTPDPPDPPAGFPGGGVNPGGSAPAAPDTDGDGFSDIYETDAGTDPNDPTSKPDIDMSILLLIDKSGSTNSENKMENAKQAAIQALAKIDKKTEIAVISYSGGCSETFPVVAEFSQNTAYLTQQIQTIQAGGGTPMAPSMLQANSYLRNQGHGKSGLIILLCDGQNDCPPNEVEAA